MVLFQVKKIEELHCKIHHVFYDVFYKLKQIWCCNKNALKYVQRDISQLGDRFQGKNNAFWEIDSWQ